jgi:hypothetical protein
MCTGVQLLSSGAIINEDSFHKEMNIRRSVFTFLLLLALLACNRPTDQISGGVVSMPNTASGKQTGEGLPEITFNDSIHDFGKVIQGEVVSYSFKFTNTGKSDLVIAAVNASCGCTATEYPKKPVKPGEEEYVRVTFSSGGREGFQKKTVTVAANTQPNTTVISIKAMVITPERN